MPSVPPPLARHVQDLASGVLTQARSRQGRIAALTVVATAAFITEFGPALRTALAERLATSGHPAVEVILRTGEGVPRLLSLEYAR